MNLRKQIVATASVLALAGSAGAILLASRARAEEKPDEKAPLRDVLEDGNSVGADFWVYNDLARATERARREGKPLFVTFRCVPCNACKGFDATVAKGSERIEALAREKFISVRQVEMKGVDLSLYRFDHDLNWAAMFVNADGIVYARYGTQSAAGPDAYNSIRGLERTMLRVLELHAAYPANGSALDGKRGKDRKAYTAFDLAGLAKREQRRGATTRDNCIHCHDIHDAEQRQAVAAGSFTRDMLWRYPLPENAGLVIDRDDGIRVTRVLPDSPAARAGIRPGDEIRELGGQPMTSISDMQWVFHHLPNTETEVAVVASESGASTLRLPAGWKVTDISWRGSMWSLPPRMNIWAPEVAAERRKSLGIAEDRMALEVQWINLGEPGGRAARDSGLREGDVIVSLDGDEAPRTPQRFQLDVKLKYKVGDEVPVTVIRDGKRRDVRIKLVD